jgi:2',3'-cyclic-nucleotide 2'-phosphodiesterase/3'-nucleotidase
VGLFHAGTDWSYNRQKREDVCNENASLIVAEEVPGFDAIFTGHDHQVHNFYATNREGGMALILGPGSKAENVAVATVEYTRRTVDRKLKFTITPAIVSMTGYLPILRSQTVSRRTPPVSKNSSPAVSARTHMPFPPGTLSSAIPNSWVSSTVCSSRSAARRFHSRAPLRPDAQIAAGPVTVRDLFKLYPYENLLYTMKLTGAEIDGYLEYSYANWMNDAYNAADTCSASHRRIETPRSSRRTLTISTPQAGSIIRST